MCRILFKENNTSLFSKDELSESYLYNSDGTGIIYFDTADSRLKVKNLLKELNLKKFTNILKV